MSGNKSVQLLSRAMALHQAGNFVAAEPLYRECLALDSCNVRALSMLGLVLAQCGKPEEGVRFMRRSLELEPRQPDVLNNLGYSLQLLSRNGESLECYQRALALNPGYVGAYFNCGNLLHDMGRYDEAVSAYRKAIALRPDYADAYVNCSNSLKELRRYEEALACCDNALALMPGRVDIHYNRGMVLHDLKRYDAALAAYRDALALDPDYVPAYANQALLYLEQGMMDEARRSLDEALMRNPDHVESHQMLLTLGNYDERDARFRKLLSLYERRQNLPLEERINLGFAMGKALEGMGRFDEAFEAYDEGNRLYYAQNPYDEEAEDKWVEWAISYYSSERLEEFAREAEQMPASADSRVPVFIVGMPRSGTTLIEQVVASHPDIYGAGELKALDRVARQLQNVMLDDWAPARPLASLRELGEKYLDEVWALAPDVNVVSDKMPANYRYLGLIHLMLPQAKIIHVERNPLDSCISCYATHFREANGYAYDLEVLGRQYRRYRKLMEHWHRVLPPGRILDVSYEKSVANPEQKVRRLLDHLGVPWDEACLKFYENKRTVQTASLTQVRRPIYSDSLARWRRFEKHLGPLIESMRAAA